MRARGTKIAAMDDPRTADGVEHLQRAARELLAAARSFLDVAEDMVEDPDRFTHAATQVVDLLRGGLGSVIPGSDSSSRLQPWETAAWAAMSDLDDSDGSTDLDGDLDGDLAGDPAGEQFDDLIAERPVTEAPRRRVRRIAVD